MKILNVRYVNFGPFVDVQIDLADKGLVLIQGDNRISTSADSNGSGKSSLLEGILWVNYGKTIRYDMNGKQTGDQFVNAKFGKEKGKNSLVCANYLIDDGSVFTIIRYRSSKSSSYVCPDGKALPSGNGVLIYINGADKTKGTVSETQKEINEILGLDFNAFVRSVYFDGHNVPAFPTLTDSEVKSAFEKILGLDDLNKALAIVKKRKEEITTEIGKVLTDIKISEAKASTARVEHSLASKRSIDFEEDRKNQIASKLKQVSDLESSFLSVDDIERKYKEIESKPEKLMAEIADLSSKIASIEKIKNDMRAISASIMDRERNLKECTSQIQAISESQNINSLPLPEKLKSNIILLEVKQAEASKKLSGLLNESKDLKGKIGTPCGECGKNYEDHDLESIISHNAEQILTSEKAIIDLKKIREIAMQKVEQWKKEEINKIESKKSEISLLIEKDGLSLESMKTEISELESIKKEKDAKELELNSVQIELSALKREKEISKDLQASVGALKQEIEDIKNKENIFIDDMKRLDAEIANMDKSLKDLESQIILKRKDEQSISIIEKAYGKNGLKAHIIENITPILNQKANEYADILTDGEVHIEFSTIHKNMDGSYSERFSVSVKNKNGAEGYLGNSSGERKKIDIAISLALSDLVSARASRPIDLWVADEIVESLDQSAIERVMDILKEKAKERGTLLVISHTDLGSHIDKSITVRKTSSGSELI